jgi:hypothetical protein
MIFGQLIHGKAEENIQRVGRRKPSHEPCRRCSCRSYHDILGHIVFQRFRAKDSLFPFVAVESFDNTHLAQLVGAALAEDQEQDGENLKTLKELSTKLDAQRDGAKSGQAFPSEESRQSTAKTISETRLAITNQLSGVFRSDLAGYMLFGQLTALYTFQNLFEGTSLRLVTAEKKGNVLYAHFLLTFIDAKSKSLLFWDRECFFVSGSSHSFLLLTSAPSSDRRPAESAWITSRLGSVRIPIE